MPRGARTCIGAALLRCRPRIDIGIGIASTSPTFAQIPCTQSLDFGFIRSALTASLAATAAAGAGARPAEGVIELSGTDATQRAAWRQQGLKLIAEVRGHAFAAVIESSGLCTLAAAVLAAVLCGGGSNTSC